jgi:hypothetical protein
VCKCEWQHDYDDDDEKEEEEEEEVQPVLTRLFKRNQSIDPRTAN